MDKNKNLQINNSVEFEFYKNYADKVAPILEEFEKERKKKFYKLIFREFMMFVAAVILTYLSFLINPFGGSREYVYLKLVIGSIPGFCSMGCFIALLILPFAYNRAFISELKKNCVPQVLNIFDNLKWREQVNILSEEALYNSQLFSRYNTRNPDDTFEGSYKGVDFKIEETGLSFIQESSSSKQNAYAELAFYGVIINFTINKTVKNTTIVAAKNDKKVKNNMGFGIYAILLVIQTVFAFFKYDLYNKTAWILSGIAVVVFLCLASAGNKHTNEEQLDTISLEDSEFNRKYNAYSSDQVEGRYLLTTAFMERFKNLHTVFGSRRAKCSFYDGNKLMIAISTNKNLFEIGNLFSPINNTKQINVFLKEIQVVYEMIDYFKLDQHTGL